MSRWGLGSKVCMHHFGCGNGMNWIKGSHDCKSKNRNLLIFNLFNGNAFLNIVILYYLLMRRDVWFENHLVFLFLLFPSPFSLFLPFLSFSLQIFGAAIAAMPHRFRQAWYLGYLDSSACTDVLKFVNRIYSIFTNMQITWILQLINMHNANLHK